MVNKNRLIELIGNTEVMTQEEKDYWIDSMKEDMTEDQIQRLFNILENERLKLEEHDKLFKEDMDKIK